VTVNDDLHHLVDELDEDAARQALVLLYDLRLPRVLREAPIDEEPETDQGDVKRLQGLDPPEWRLRVGEWRIRFAYDFGSSAI
jgi:hypothetical protein